MQAARLDTYVIRDDESLMHDVIDVLYDVTDRLQRILDSSSFFHRYTEA